MILTRTPLRISLGGGGTDLPSYYVSRGHGFLLAAAINRYVYVAVNSNFENKILLKYSQIENCDRIEDIRHPLLRECLRACGVSDSIEVSSMADIPAGTGLGSSGAFTVGVLKALKLFRHVSATNESIAQEACRIEIEILGEPVGKQDQFIAACGGINTFTFKDSGEVLIEALRLDPLVRLKLEENLLLFYTGLKRSASDALRDERSSIGADSSSLSSSLDQTREIGYHTKEVIEKGDLETFGSLLTKQWKLKFNRQPTPLHQNIDHWISKGIKAGALGGKLVGAGGGGFLLFYSDRKSELRKQMSILGLPEVPFGFDYEGSSIVVPR